MSSGEATRPVADLRAVAKALIAAQKTPAANNGGFGGVPSTLPAVSPLVASYGDYTYGRPVAAALPREAASFLTGSFGPLAPIQPVPVDVPDPESGRPDPRRYEYQVGWNMPIGPPGDEGLKLASFGQLRVIADTYSVARACIQVRKNELLGLGWDVVPTPQAEKAMRADKDARREFEDRRKKVIRFFRRPDYNYFSFRDWYSALLEDVLVIDALSLFLHPTKVGGKGVLGSDLGQLAALDGSTIKPLVDIEGARPLPPNVAYQQFLYGVPRVDLMQVLDGTDVAEMMDARSREYRGDQLIYRPYVARDWTPYGFPPVERALVPILSGIQRQQWQLDAYSQRSIPGLFISTGDPNATPSQLRELQDALNAMAGDPAWQHKIIVLPAGSKIDPQRPAELSGPFDEILMTQTAMAFDVQPMELGITPRSSTTQGAANQMAKSSKDINDRKANKPLLEWFGDIFNHVLQDVCRQEDMQWWWEGLEESDDEQTRTAIEKERVSIGLMSVDEARIKSGEQPWGLPLTSEPVLITPTGVVPFGSIDPQTGQPAGLTPKLTAAPPPPGQFGPGKDGPDDDGPPGPAKPKPPKPPKGGPSGSGTSVGNTPTPAHAAGQQSSSASVATKGEISGKRIARYLEAGPAVNLPAMSRELDLIRRRLAKGRGLGDWTPETIPVDVFRRLVARAATDPAGAVAEARATIQATHHRASRDIATGPAERAVVDGLHGLTEGLASGAVGTAQFVDAAVAVLRAGIRAGLGAGVARARTDRAVGKADGTGWIDRMDGRFGLYAGQVPRAYEHGFGLAILGAAGDPDSIVIRWHARDDACELCAARAERGLFTVGTLPGFPGDGSFGELCEGGPNCRCWLSYQRLDDGQLAPAPAVLPGGPTPEPAQVWSTTPTRMVPVEQVTAAREALTGPAPDRAMAVLLDRIADEQAETQRPYLTGLMRGVLTRATRNADPAQARRRGGVDVALPVGAVVAPATAAAVAEQAASQRGATPETGQVSKHVGHGDATHEVYAYLARHYPAHVIDWAKDAHWHGPVSVKLSDIDMTRRPGGARNPDKVRSIATALEDGHTINPVVLVHSPGVDRYEIADGWHRTLAALHAGRDHIQAWVGDASHGDWGAPMNRASLDKAKRPVAAGLAVRASDTSRVLMLQRAMTDADPAAGMWEFPGGKIEPGEDPQDAARREWSEEVGIAVPPGEITGDWTSSNGVYRGYVLSVPSEDDVPIFDGRDDVTNPDDPDGDSTEALAWWDPDQLANNPAVRAELLADLDEVLPQIEETPQVTKAAYAEALKVDEGGAGDYRARHLIRWYEHGEGAARIGWGAPGDFDRCVTIASEHMTEEQAKDSATAATSGRWGSTRLPMRRKSVTPPGGSCAILLEELTFLAKVANSADPIVREQAYAAYRRGLRELGKRFNPDQPRGHDGRWIHGADALVSTVFRRGKSSVAIHHHGDGTVTLEDVHGHHARLNADALRQLRHHSIMVAGHEDVGTRPRSTPTSTAPRVCGATSMVPCASTPPVRSTPALRPTPTRSRAVRADVTASAAQ